MRGLILLQVVRAIVPKIILDDVFTVNFPFSSLPTFCAIVVCAAAQQTLPYNSAGIRLSVMWT